ncbi:MAG: threonine synthase [Halanaerobiaceae bacterium]
MKYISTRGNYKKVESAEAIRTGMVPTGGLFVPEDIPAISMDEITKMKEKDYQQIVFDVIKRFLTDYSDEELMESIENAYNDDSFPVDEVAPLVKLNDHLYILELWHGPTAAFKDMALQLMPQLLTRAVKKSSIDREIVILVATSGDTGKAALEGFKDVEGIKIIVFYPADGVSKIQELQMNTTTGANTDVVSVEGNFDDCQTAVKSVFSDEEFIELMNKNDYQFSSANSINWGRLVPQIVYYFSSYAYLLKSGVIETGDRVNFAVPTGNFGNILAGFYAYRMGLPVNKFICASNDNKVLTDFLNTGIYDANRDFKKTISPSMDILISSNLERFLFEITGHNADKINQWYSNLKEEGKFEIDTETLDNIQSIFTGDYSTEEEACKTIKEIYKKYKYIVDPHTAVGVNVYNKHIKNTADGTVTVVDSTANPYKFSKAVLESLKGKSAISNGYENLEELRKVTGMDIHRALKNLDSKEIRHNRKSSSEAIRKEIKDILNI